MPIWNNFKFKISCAGNPCSAHIDLSIIDLLLGMVLGQYKESIITWRFHRRCAPINNSDERLHLLSFHLLAERDIAMRIHDEIIDDEFVVKLRSARHIENIDREEVNSPGDLGNIVEGEVAAQNWDPIIKKAWHSYIEGCSGLLLNMIKECHSQRREEIRAMDIEDIIELYENIRERINALFFKNGAHSLFHHLHALFHCPEFDAGINAEQFAPPQINAYGGIRVKVYDIR